jgi:hypothetical protein
MNYQEKLYAIMGKLGKIKTSEYFDMTYPTFLSRTKNPGDWRMDEIDIIDKLYEQLFSENK